MAGAHQGHRRYRTLLLAPHLRDGRGPAAQVPGAAGRCSAQLAVHLPPGRLLHAAAGARAQDVREHPEAGAARCRAALREHRGRAGRVLAAGVLPGRPLRQLLDGRRRRAAAVPHLLRRAQLLPQAAELAAVLLRAELHVLPGVDGEPCHVAPRVPQHVPGPGGDFLRAARRLPAVPAQERGGALPVLGVLRRSVRGARPRPVPQEVAEPVVGMDRRGGLGRPRRHAAERRTAVGPLAHVDLGAGRQQPLLRHAGTLGRTPPSRQLPRGRRLGG